MDGSVIHRGGATPGTALCLDDRLRVIGEFLRESSAAQPLKRWTAFNINEDRGLEETSAF